MSMSLTFLTGAAIAALSFAVPQGDGLKGQKGPITLEEMKAAADARFAKMDSDGDGYLSEADRPDPSTRFALVDADGSGVIAKEEFIGEALSRFDTHDVNGNGILDEGERPEKEGRRSGTRRGDRGQMTRDTLEAKVTKHFNRLDANENGELTEEEFSSSREGRRGGRMKGKKSHHDMTAIDSDGDGRISKAEHDAHVEARFTNLDTNDDGIVTDEERRAAKDSRKGRKGDKKNR